MLLADADRIRKMKLFRAALILSASVVAFSAPQSLGIFQDSNDVGQVLHPGSAQYDAAAQAYTVTGSGTDIWSAEDDFHFLWRKVSARDMSLSADIELLGSGGNNHRKAVLMIRQSLDADSVYADAARHGDGLTSLQFRDQKGAATHEVESNVSGPKRLRIEKRGNLFYLWVGDNDQNMHFAGGSTRVTLKSPFYIGLGVSSHDKDALQRAAFSNVDFSTEVRGAHARYSTLETVAVASTDARVTYVSEQVISAPSWSKDGESLIFRSGDQIQCIPVAGGTPEALAGQSGPEAEGSHASPDGKQRVSVSEVKRSLLISVIQAAGNNEKVIVKLPDGGAISDAPWSPDGKRLAFVSYQRP